MSERRHANDEPLDLGLLPGLLGYRLRRAQIAAFQHFAATVGKAGVTPGWFGLMVIVANNEGLSQTRLARAGWKIWYEPAAWLIHHESQSQGAGSSRFAYRYTKNRLRYLALHGAAQGWRTACREEARWLADVRGGRRLAAVLRAYATGLVKWIGWRMDRRRRRTVPRLPSD